MTPRERLIAMLNHETPDRVCVDFGPSGQTGMGAGDVHRLRQAVLGKSDYRIKIIEPYQMSIAVWFIPFLARLHLHTIYQYLEKHLGVVARSTAAGVFLLLRSRHPALTIWVKTQPEPIPESADDRGNANRLRLGANPGG
jgi:hypothetical protein